MTKLRQILGVIFDALIESNQTVAKDSFVAEGEQERQAARRAAAGDSHIRLFGMLTGP